MISSPLISDGPKSRTWLLGLIYGLLMAFWGFGAAGAGHGTYVVLGAVSSPFGIFGILAALICLPIFWAFVGFALDRVERRSYLIIFVASVAAHYIGIIPLLLTETYGDWEDFQKAWSVGAITIAGGVATYVIGQLLMWILFASRTR